MADTVQKGSDAWARGLRKKAKELAHSVTLDYVSLATTLWDMYDTPMYGDPNNPPAYTMLWGYNKLSDFAKEELGLEPRKADYLRGIGKLIKVDLVDADPNLMERFLNLGWTKVREIGRVLKAHQLQEWVIQAEQSNFKEIEAMVLTYRTNEQKAEEERAILTGGYTLSKDPFAPPKSDIVPTNTIDGADINVSVSGAEFSSILAVPPVLDELAPLPSVPVPEKLTTETFSLYDEQLKDVKKALTKAGEISGSTKKSHNLALICANFLITNDFSGVTEEQRLKLVAKLEKLLGYKIVAANPDDYSVAYGIDNLKKIAAFQVSQQVVEVATCSR